MVCVSHDGCDGIRWKEWESKCLCLSSLSSLYHSPHRLWKCSSWNFRSAWLAAASEAVIPSCQCVLVPSCRMAHIARPLLLLLAFFLHADAESKPSSPSLGGWDHNEWFCLQLAPCSGLLNMFPLEVNPETLWDPPWLPASLSERLLMWLPYHFLSLNALFLVHLTALTVLAFFFWYY